MITYKYVFTFGKHKGKTVKEVKDIDPQYLLWANKNIEQFKLSKQLKKEIKEYIEELNSWYGYSEFWKD